MAAACTLYKTKRFTKKFVASITVSLGFQIIGNGDDPDYPYVTKLTLDKSSIKLAEEITTLPATVSIPDLDNPGQTIEIPCDTKMRQFKLNGPLFYNSVVSGFKALEPFEPTPVEGTSVQIVEPTKFSDSKTIQINDVIAYTCAECDMTGDALSEFDVEIEQGTEFVINNKGEQIPHTEADPENFFDELQGTETQVIYIPYTLVFEPKAPAPTPAPTPEP